MNMHLVFMNSLEKRMDEQQRMNAKVTIGEQEGVWQVLWTEVNVDGEQQQTRWFEGESWNEMLQTFRSELLRKMADGYVPLLDNITTEVQTLQGRAEWIQKLLFYSDLHKHEATFDELKEWRRQKAVNERKAPYLIATNRLLSLISTFLPQTEDELLQLPGFGPFKLRMYGKELLTFTTKVKRETSFPLDWVPERIDVFQFKLWLHHQQLSFEERERFRKEQRQAVIDAAAQGWNIAQLEKVKLFRREALVLMEELHQEGHDMSPMIEMELVSLPIAERERASQLFSQLGDRYLKPVLNKLLELEVWKEMQTEDAYEKLRLLRMKHRKAKQVA